MCFRKHTVVKMRLPHEVRNSLTWTVVVLRYGVNQFKVGFELSRDHNQDYRFFPPGEPVRLGPEGLPL